MFHLQMSDVYICIYSYKNRKNTLMLNTYVYNEDISPHLNNILHKLSQ